MPKQDPRDHERVENIKISRECTAGRDCNSLCVIQRRNDLETL